MGIAITVRVWGVNFGLPNWYPHTDETLTFRKVLRIEENPYYKYDPLSLFHYVLDKSEYLYGRVMSLLKIDYKRGTLYPGIMMMWRIITALMSSISVYLAYLIGKKLYNSKVGLLAATVLGFTLLDVFRAHIVKQDTYNQVLGLLAFLGAILIYKKGDLKYYFMTGLIIGVATAIKPNGIIFLVFFIPAHILKYPTVKEAFDIREIKYKIPVSVAALFLGLYLGSPYDLSNPKHIIDAFWYQLSRAVLAVDRTEFAKIGHGITLTTIISKMKWINMYFANSGLWYSIYAASIGGFLITIKNHRKEDMILISFPASYLIVLSLRSVIYDRWMTLFTPFLAIFAAIFLYELYRFLSNRFRLVNEQKIAVMFLLLGVFIGYPAFRVFLFDYCIAGQDTRETAYRWIKENLPKDEMIFTTHLTTTGLHPLGMKLAEDGYFSETIGGDLSSIKYNQGLFRFKNGIVMLSSANREVGVNSLIRSKSRLLKRISNYWFENEFFGKHSLGLNDFSNINHLHNPTIEIYRLPEVDTVNKDGFRYHYYPDKMSASSMKLIADPEATTKKAMYANKEKNHHLAGPYRLFPPGMYKVIYKLKTDGSAIGDHIVTVDVSKTGTKLRFAIKKICGVDFNESNVYQKFVLPLYLKRAERLETRIFTNRKANVWVDSVTVKELTDESEFQELIEKAGHRLTSSGQLVSKYPRIYSFNELEKFTNGKGVRDNDSIEGYAILNGSVWGPYEELAEGEYVASFRLKVDNNKYDREVAMIDVAEGGTGKPFTRKSLLQTDFTSQDEYQIFTLAFTLDKTTQLEFRVFYKNSTNLWVDNMTVEAQ